MSSDDPPFSILPIHRAENKNQDVVDKEWSTLSRFPLYSASSESVMKNSTTTISTKSRSKSTTTKEKKEKKVKKEKKHPEEKTSSDGSKSKVARKKKETLEVPDIRIQGLVIEDKQLTTTRETQEHLKRILDGANTLVVPGSSTRTHSTKSKTKKKKGDSKDKRKQKQGGDKEDKQTNSPSKTARKEEEIRKRREPLMVSPFDYLQVKHFESPRDDCSVFPDDISHLTLPKQLQELEMKHHGMPSLLCFLEEEKPDPYPSSKVASLLGEVSPVVEPNPGWSRKSRSRSRRRSKLVDNSTVDDTPRSAAETIPVSPPRRSASPSPNEKKSRAVEDSSLLLRLPEILTSPEVPRTPISHCSGSIADAAPSFPANTKSFVSRSAHTDESDVETGFVDKDAEIVIIRVRDDQPSRHNHDDKKQSLFYPCAYSIMGFLMIVIISAILVIFLTPGEDSAR